MSTTSFASKKASRTLTPAFDRIARRIGFKLRDIYAAPETEPLPVEHVELLLRLRHKERERSRATSSV